MVKKKSAINEYKYMVGVLLGAVLIAVVLFMVIGQPLYASLKKTNLELDEKKLVLDKLETNLETLKGLESRKAEIEEKNAKVLAALPADKDVPRLFTQLEKIAATAGLNITSVSESSATDSATPAATTPGQINSLTYQVTGSASNYSSLKAALAKIEDGLRIVSIDKVDAQGGQSGSSLTVNLTIRTFSRGE